MGQGNGRHGVDDPTANGQRLTGVNGIHTGVDGQRNVNLLTGIAQTTQTQQTRQVVVHHRFHILEPLQLGGPLVVVEPPGKQHQPAITRAPMAVQ
jgi:hypothetical protein